MNLAAGIGYVIPQPITRAINSILSALNVTHRIQSSGGLQTKPVDIVRTATWEPDLPVCKPI